MGIVMAVIMLLGTLALVKLRFRNNIVSIVLLSGGLWNLLWYGAFHVGSFWGHAAIITGLVMVFSAIHLFGFIKLPDVMNKIYAMCLFAGFLLYSVTIIQLNLGIPIIN